MNHLIEDAERAALRALAHTPGLPEGIRTSPANPALPGFRLMTVWCQAATVTASSWGAPTSSGTG